ncbi:MAG: glutathione S-transferase family protein [Cellvibrionales bacterium]|nr:glutathione S-transferase family protein [Cellvibrionales bacterium]
MAYDKFTLYHHPASRSSRARWALIETLGNEGFDLVTFDLYEASQYDDDFLKKNPNHAVPVLAVTKDNETHHIFESGAIILWLADSFPTAELAPLANNFSLERATFLQWFTFVSNSFDAMLWQIRLNEELLPTEKADTKTPTRYREKITTDVEPQLVAQLADNAYFLGDKFSAVDIILTHCLLWAQMYGLCTHDKLNAYVERMMARPSFLQAYDDMDKFNPALSDDAPLKDKLIG